MLNISSHPNQALDVLPEGVSPQVTGLFDYWRQKAPEGGVPHRALFGPFELRRWLNFISIYEHLREHGDFRNRLEGTGIVELTGEDWTGGLASEIDAQYGTQLTADLAATISSGAPSIHRITVFQKQYKSALRLLLPVTTTAGGAADQVLLSIFAEGGSGPIPAPRTPP